MEAGQWREHFNAHHSGNGLTKEILSLNVVAPFDSNTALFDGINSEKVACWQDIYERVVSIPENSELLVVHREKLPENYADLPPIAVDHIHKKYNPYLLEHTVKFFEVNPHYKTKGLIRTLIDLVEAVKNCNLPHLDTILADKVYKHVLIYYGFDNIQPNNKPTTNQTNEVILELKKELRISEMSKRKRRLEKADRRNDNQSKAARNPNNFQVKKNYKRL